MHLMRLSTRRFWLSMTLAAGLSGANVATLDADTKGAWGRFRGPNGSGIGGPLAKVDSLNAESVVWKKEVAGGTSSPIVVDGKMYLTTFEGKTRSLVALDPANGNDAWHYDIEAVRSETATPPNNPATCTPVSDGKFVVALFPDAALVVCDTNGQLVWKKDLGPFYSMHGISASPILVDDKVVVAIDQLSESYIVAFDVTSGEEKWRADRLIGVTGGYATPGVIEFQSKKYIVSPAPSEMLIYELESGKKAVSIAGLTNAPVSAPAIQGSRFCYSEPPGQPLRLSDLGPVDKNNDGVVELDEVKKSVGMTRLLERIDKGFGNNDGKMDAAEFEKAFNTFLNRGGLSCVELVEKDGALQGEVRWNYAKTTPYISSALLLNGLVYVVNDGGIMLCLDAESGELLKRERLGGATGSYYASPIAAGDKIVVANMEGKVSVLQSGKEFRVLQSMDLGEQIVATPCVDNGRLYIRTDDALYCF